MELPHASQAIQHDDEATTTDNRLSGQPLLADIFREPAGQHVFGTIRIGHYKSRARLPLLLQDDRSRMPASANIPASRPAGAPDALSLLNSVFGLPGFRGAQEEIIRHVTQGGNCLVLMPTGGGKSLCYQLPALLRKGCGIVVSPLIALMRDQVAALHEAGVRAAVLNSTLAFDEAAAVEARLVAGDLDLLYVAPERLVTPRCLSMLAQAKVALFAIDEAHCVSQWGHDFRPEYIGLSAIAEGFPHVPRIALTATADDLSQK